MRVVRQTTFQVCSRSVAQKRFIASLILSDIATTVAANYYAQKYYLFFPFLFRACMLVARVDVHDTIPRDQKRIKGRRVVTKILDAFSTTQAGDMEARGTKHGRKQSIRNRMRERASWKRKTTGGAAARISVIPHSSIHPSLPPSLPLSHIYHAPAKTFVPVAPLPNVVGKHQ